MLSKKIKKPKLNIFNQNQSLFLSLVIMCILCPSYVISEQLTKQRFDEINTYSKKSFITKAVEKTGSSVVTIDTQRYIRKRKF